MSELSQIKKIGLLSTVFTLGAVLVVLSCSLYHNWLPLKSLLFFLLAPVPHALWGSSRNDDIMSDSNESAIDFARFLTSIFLVSAYALPLIFSHNHIITHNAMLMSLTGGSLIYGTIVTFGAIFAEHDEY